MKGRLGLLVVVFAAVSAAAGPSCKKDAVTAPTLTAVCAATPATGPAPLTVAFSLSVAGGEGAFSVAVNYGDGTQGIDPDARHVYTTGGSYNAAFTVTSGSQTARCSTPVSVTGAPAPTPAPANEAPTPVFNITPRPVNSTITGTAPLQVAFNMCQTADPDKDVLYFKMDLDGDRIYEFHGSTGADCRHTVTYGLGTRTATICVTDVDCTTWPACEGLPQRHPFQCRATTVVAN